MSYTAERRFSPARLLEARGTHSVEAAAAAAGVSYRTICNWEAGRSAPPATKLAKLAALYRRPVGFFFESVA